MHPGGINTRIATSGRRSERTSQGDAEAGLAIASALRVAIEAHYASLEAQLGRRKLAQLYELLDDLIALEGDDEDHKPMTEDTLVALSEVPR